jgi:integrase
LQGFLRCRLGSQTWFHRCRFRAAADEQDAAIFLTAAYTGLRVGELRALRRPDVDFAGERILVREG